MKIIQATSEHLEDLVPLFDGYRIFYRQKSDQYTAREFLKERLTKQDSVIYLAYIDNIAVGFTQLYSLLSSVSMQPMYVLNDLYIDNQYQNNSVGTALIDKSKQFCKKQNFKGLIIQTEKTNPAQYLYERLGFIKDQDLTLFWPNK